MQAFRLDQNLRFTWEGQAWIVLGSNGPMTVQVQRLMDSRILTMQVTDIYRWLEDRTLTIDHDPDTATPALSQERLAQASPKYLKTANHRLEVLRPLLSQAPCSGKTVRNIAAAHHLSPRTLWRWLHAYRQMGFEGMIPGWGHGTEREPRLKNDRAQEIFRRVVEEEFLKGKAVTKAHVVRAIQDQCAFEGMRVPRSTLYWLLGKLPPALVTLRRQGQKAFEKDFLATPTRFAESAATAPLTLVEIDHTLLDLELLDEETGHSLGRPWLTLGFDVHSRRPWGYYLSFDHPGAVSVMQCLRHGILQKQTTRQYATQHEWEAFGVPATIIVDNGKEFHSAHFQALCGTLEITLRYRPRRTPRFGGVIERAFGTLNQRLLHNLLGNTKTMINVRMKNRNPREEAVWTLPRLDQLLNLYFCDVHPFEIHRNLNGRTPAQVWTEGINFAGCPRYPNNLEAFHHATLPIMHRTVSREGVVIDHIHFHHPHLGAFVGVKQAVEVKWDPFDMSYVLVKNPKTTEWIRAVVKNPSLRETSWSEYRLIRKVIQSQNQSVNQGTIALARERIRQKERAAGEHKNRVVREQRRGQANLSIFPTRSTDTMDRPQEPPAPSQKSAVRLRDLVAGEDLPDL